MIIWQTSVALLVLINWLIKLLCAAILHHVQASANGAIRHLASQLRTRTTVRRSSAHMCAWCMAILWAMMPTARNLKRVDGYAAAHHQDVEWSCNPSSILCFFFFVGILHSFLIRLVHLGTIANGSKITLHLFSSINSVLCFRHDALMCLLMHGWTPSKMNRTWTSFSSLTQSPQNFLTLLQKQFPDAGRIAFLGVGGKPAFSCRF